MNHKSRAAKRAVSNGGVSRSGLVLPLLSFFVLFGTFPIFPGFSRFARGFSRPNKVGNPRFGTPLFEFLSNKARNPRENQVALNVYVLNLAPVNLDIE